MTDKPSDVSATVAHFKAIADEKLAQLRASSQYDSFLNENAIEAFSRIEQSSYAGRPHASRKRAS
ncbi:hypothetical protein KSS93_14335 [Pseudomonas xanthosomatis]|uniref:hypothetical protein n=1 Tax=Pseudomonas xanthosomatis TaxID=2842356 RepID=UPI001C3D9B70|nr:hypothetical protein [Pseudomonas xanthosomatis]QXH44082.1 hypothetical protein KSS93_14335 [Pseudomonas xanthosomatis]